MFRASSHLLLFTIGCDFSKHQRKKIGKKHGLNIIVKWLVRRLNKYERIIILFTHLFADDCSSTVAGEFVYFSIIFWAKPAATVATSAMRAWNKHLPGKMYDALSRAYFHLFSTNFSYLYFARSAHHTHGAASFGFVATFWRVVQNLCDSLSRSFPSTEQNTQIIVSESPTHEHVATPSIIVAIKQTCESV